MAVPISPLLAAALLVACGGRLRALPLVPEAFYAVGHAAPWPVAVAAAVVAPLLFSGSPGARGIVHAAFLLALLGAPCWLVLAGGPPLVLGAAGLDGDRRGRLVLAAVIVVGAVLRGLAI